MKNWCPCLAVLLCATGLLACASQPDKKPKNITESFEVDIKPNSLKLFTYKVHAEIRAGRREIGKQTGRAGGQKLNLKAMKSKQKENILARLDDKLAETNFCRDGYTIINSYFERELSEIKGECNDGATEDDRKKFSSSKPTNTTSKPAQLSDENLILNKLKQ